VTEPLKHLLSVFAGSHSSKGYENLFEVRNVLEVQIAGIAAERASEQEIQELQRINRTLAALHRKESQWSESSLARYNDLDFQFHLMLAKCTHNDFFVVLMTALSEAFKSTWNRLHVHADVRSHGMELHDKILNAIRARDPHAARQATQENLKAFLADAEEKSLGTPPAAR
jgi:GntR family transcriptional regulator, transcriptional repressor for pyruvate dehydrogenase complex